MNIIESLTKIHIWANNGVIDDDEDNRRDALLAVTTAAQQLIRSLNNVPAIFCAYDGGWRIEHVPYRLNRRGLPIVGQEWYHYSECGMSNVFLKLETVHDSITIPDVNGLHKLLLAQVVNSTVLALEALGQPDRARFLVTELNAIEIFDLPKGNANEMP